MSAAGRPLPPPDRDIGGARAIRVAVAIVGYRNAEDVARCLRALGQSIFPDFDVVICENGGAEAFAMLQVAAPNILPGGQQVTLIQAPENVGFAGGVNICLATCDGADAAWLLNPDTEPEPGALSAMVSRLGEGDCDAVGGPLVSDDGGVQGLGGRWRPWLARSESIGMGSSVGDRPDAAAVERDQDYIMGASLLASRRFLRTTGPMREDYFLYAEEIEWCLRGVDRGMKLGFAPAAVVPHRLGAATGSGVTLSERPRLPIFMDERNKILLVRDRNPGLLPVAALSALVFLTWRYGVKGGARPFRHALAGWWAGVRDQRGRPAFVGA